MEPVRFTAKVRPRCSLYHFWSAMPVKDSYVALCNKGLVRSGDELFEVLGDEKMCKVCKYHKGRTP